MPVVEHYPFYPGLTSEEAKIIRTALRLYSSSVSVISWFGGRGKEELLEQVEDLLVRLNPDRVAELKGES